MLLDSIGGGKGQKTPCLSFDLHIGQQLFSLFWFETFGSVMTKAV